MKTRSIYIFFIGLTLFSYCGMAYADGLNTIGVKVPLPTGVKIITPHKDLKKEIAAFSGVWHGKWNTYNRDIVLIVEEIHSKKANVIYCIGESTGLYNAPARCERNRAVVSMKNLQIEFAVRETRFYTFRMGNNLGRVKMIMKTPLATVEMSLAKVK